MLEVTNVETDEGHETVKHPYTLVFLSLFVLTLAEINLGFIRTIVTDVYLGSLIIAGLVIMALMKAYLVGAYFMGIKYLKNSKLITAGVFGVPLFIAIPVVSFPVLGTALYLCGI